LGENISHLTVKAVVIRGLAECLDLRRGIASLLASIIGFSLPVISAGLACLLAIGFLACRWQLSVSPEA
jgi:hypothetical protein